MHDIKEKRRICREFTKTKEKLAHPAKEKEKSAINVILAANGQ